MTQLLLNPEPIRVLESIFKEFKTEGGQGMRMDSGGQSRKDSEARMEWMH